VLDHGKRDTKQIPFRALPRITPSPKCVRLCSRVSYSHVHLTWGQWFEQHNRRFLSSPLRMIDGSSLTLLHGAHHTDNVNPKSGDVNYVWSLSTQQDLSAVWLQLSEQLPRGINTGYNINCSPDSFTSQKKRTMIDAWKEREGIEDNMGGGTFEERYI
jgi:hypothetical protein